MNKLHLIVRDQFPDFIREDYPLFVAFVEAYYKWLDEQSVGSIETVADLDKTPQQFVQYFKTQLDAYGIFNTTTFNPLYLQKIKEIYNSKGSEQSLVNILRLTHNADTIISYPSDYILRASDGKWEQESFFAIQYVYGSVPDSAIECFIKYDNVDVRLEISHLEQISTSTTRVYFKLRYDLKVSVDQFVYFYGSDRNIQYVGKIVRIPVSISILKGGKDWQLGQVIVIPGTTSDTVARVSEVDADGGIVSVEILQYGYEHTENQTLIVSPYPNKPLGTSYDIVTTQTSVNPQKFLHTLTIYDYTDGATDRVVGISSGIMGTSYFLQNYVEPGYVGSIAFDNSTNDVISGSSVDTSITMEQWLASRATIVYEYGTLVTQRGRWLDDSSIISNESIKLQDNFYYQQFSYDIQSDANSQSYLELANLLNPVGMKMFTTYNLSEVIEVGATAVTSFPFLKIDLLDVSTMEDSDKKLVLKKLVETLSVTDYDKETVTKKPTDSVTLSDVDKESVSKRITDTLTTSDVDKESVTKGIAELLTIGEVVPKTYNKYVADSATISSPDTSVSTRIQYNIESYFAENYVESQINLTIGA